MNIEITPKKTDGLERLIEVRVPVETVAAAEETAAKRYATSVRLPGFRPGKAPPAMIKKRFKDAIREIGPQDVQRLAVILPAAWDNLQTRLEGSYIDTVLDDQLTKMGEQAGGFASRIPSIAGNILSSFASLLVVIVGGVFLAARPGEYRDGVVLLVPEKYRERVREGLNDSGEALRMWFWGQFLSMIIVGSLTGIGLWILGVPSSLALGLIAGLAQFVPIVGPVVAALPGLIIAAASGGHTLIWTLVVYTGVSQLESNLITPMIQNQIASIPAVLTLFAIMGFAILLGPLGVALAMPLTVVIYTLVRKHMIRSGKLTPKPPRRLFRKRPKAS